MDFSLTKEQLALAQMVEEFAANEIAPLTEAMEESESFLPPEVWKKMAELNMIGPQIPEEYGGLGLGAMEMMITKQAALRGGASLGTLLSWGAHDVIGCMAILKHGTLEQKKKYLPYITSGERISCFAITEPNAGSDAFSMKTRAVKKGDYYVLNGTKMFITNGPICDMGIVIAVTDPDKGPMGLSAFIFEKEFPGFKKGKPIKKMGMRCSPTGELIFEDCLIPKENLLGGEGQGAWVADTTLHWERCALGCAVGAMEYNLKLCIEYAKTRVQFGEPIGNFQAVRHRLAEMKVDIEAAKYLFYRLAWLLDTDQVPAHVDFSVAKAFVSKALMKNVDYAVSMFGGYGVCMEYPVQRTFRDAKVIEIGGGTLDIQYNTIARGIIGRRQKKVQEK